MAESTRTGDVRSGTRGGARFRPRSRLARVLTAVVALAAVTGGVVALMPRQAVAGLSLAPKPLVPAMARNLIPVPALGVPQPLPMTYGGGQVEVTPKVYLVFWGWDSRSNPVATLMQRFVGAMGGTAWAGLDTQYYEIDSGQQVHITNPSNILAGVWFDNADPIHDNLTSQDIADEAWRGYQHFGTTDYHNSNVVVVQPQNANDSGFNNQQYCAWHDTSSNNYTLPAGTPQFAFTSMPYVLNAGAGCGKDFVNPAPGGDFDGFTIVLGHEIAEAITDPGAAVGTDSGWLDLNGGENGDKCAWVDIGPGGVTNMTGNDGRTYPVQGLWDNARLLGLGYCSN